MTGLEQHRIVISGIGLITSLGIGINKNFNEIISLKSGIKPVDSFDTTPYRNNLYSHINDKSIDNDFSEKEQRRSDRCYKLLEIAAMDAISDANLDRGIISASNVGLYLGSIMAGDQFAHELHASVLKRKNYLRNRSYLMPKHVYADLLVRKLQLTGPRMLISTACTASTLAISIAAESILNEQVDFAFAGGSDPVSEYIFAGFHNMRNISKEPCAPFSYPDGMTLGEGAGFLILERMDKALNRGARIYAELLGYAMTADAVHPTSPDLTGESHKRLMEKAMRQSGIERKDIDYINLHGTGTKANDKTESVGLGLVFGDEVKDIKVSSIKGAVGHILGGAGVVEAAVTIMSLYQQKLIPNIGFKGHREGCNLNIVQKTEKAELNIALSNNYAFGGNNACLVLAKYKQHQTIKRALDKPDSVVISGIGFISPFGSHHSELITGLNKNNKPISNIEGIPCFSVMDPILEDLISYDARRADRLGKIILAATQLAFNDAGLSSEHVDLNEVGIISGTSYSHLTSNVAFNEMIVLDEPLLANPIDFANSVTNAGCGLASINLGVKGCNIAISTGQISGIQSLTLGYDLIKSGRERIVICGGADCLDKFLLQSMAKVFKTASLNNSVLLDAILNGETEKTLFGEGACYFVLESAESAKLRKAPIYCKIEGYGACGDFSAKNLCGDVEKLMEATMYAALKKSQKKAEDINLIIRADLLLKHQNIGEINAIERIFGPASPHISYSSFFGISSVLSPFSLASAILSRGLIEKGDVKKKACNMLLNSMSLGGNATSLVLSN